MKQVYNATQEYIEKRKLLLQEREGFLVRQKFVKVENLTSFNFALNAGVFTDLAPLPSGHLEGLACLFFQEGILVTGSGRLVSLQYFFH
jgi:hypothetical protein